MALAQEAISGSMWGRTVHFRRSRTTATGLLQARVIVYGCQII